MGVGGGGGGPGGQPYAAGRRKGRGASKGSGTFITLSKGFGQEEPGHPRSGRESHRLFHVSTVVEKEEGKETKKYQNYF